MRGKGYEIDEKENGEIAGLIGALPRVDAPGDFNSRTWARIEAGRTRTTYGLFAILRVAVPACLLLALGGYFAYSTLYSRPAEPPIITSQQPEAQPAPAPPSEVRAPEDQVALSAPDRADNTGKVSEDPLSPKASRDRTISQPGGSYDEALGAGANRMPQRGFPQNPQLGNVNAAGTGTEIAIKDVLEQLGIRAEYRSGAWKVASVSQNNIAQKAGVLPGDIIEAFNDQVLTQKTQLGRSFTGMSLRVRRNAQTITLDLKP